MRTYPFNAKRLAYGIASTTLEGTAFPRLPSKPSRVRRILWWIVGPMFLSLATVLLGAEWVRFLM